MAPSLNFVSIQQDYEVEEQPVAKKRKTSLSVLDDDDELEPALFSATPPHPLGVKPLGNAYESKLNLKSHSGALARLPEELLFQTLEYLDGETLTRLGATCKVLYAFSRAEELWKALFVECVCLFRRTIQIVYHFFTHLQALPCLVICTKFGAKTSRDRSPPSPFSWQGTWRSTFLSIPPARQSSISCSGVYSDILHRPFFCAHAPLTPYVSNIPARNQIPRFRELTPEAFNRDWANKPFILTDPVKEWPAYHSWSLTNLLSRYRATPFRAEAVDWPLERYIDYMRQSSDESPLYLFDCRFAEKMNVQVGREHADAAYWAPDCFGEDLFAVLGDQRPDSRWLIIGPERSGSTFHKDPNATSAWNAVLSGAKYWIMFPSSANLPPPPGVYISEDQSEVTSPLSIAEWLIGFHAEARRTPGCYEGVCGEGEVLHVPSGWYHLVLNLAPSVALTQNFIPKAHLGAALEFLRDRGDQISGFGSDVRDPYGIFVERMRERYPDLLDEALTKLESVAHGKKNAWEELRQSVKEDGSSGFSFGFGFGGDGEDEIP